MPPGAVAAELWARAGAQADAGGAPLGRERAAVAGASRGRRREFAEGRACAREALGKLGVEPVEIPVGEGGAPRWPAGVIGSITHKGLYRAAAVARAERMAGLGVDAELDRPLPAGVLRRIAGERELEAVERLSRERPGISWDRLLFSAKEAGWKALAAPAERPPGLRQVAVALPRAGEPLTVELARGQPAPGWPPARGAWLRWRGMLLVAVAQPTRVEPARARLTAPAAPR